MKHPFPKGFIRLPHKYFKRHLHGSRETLARLTSNTSVKQAPRQKGFRTGQLMII